MCGVDWNIVGIVEVLGQEGKSRVGIFSDELLDNSPLLSLQSLCRSQ